MALIRRFEDILAWQEARKLVVEIYAITYWRTKEIPKTSRLTATLAAGKLDTGTPDTEILDTETLDTGTLSCLKTKS